MFCYFLIERIRRLGRLEGMMGGESGKKRGGRMQGGNVKKGGGYGVDGRRRGGRGINFAVGDNLC